MGDPMKVGIVGIGQISGQYLKTLPRLTNLTLTAVADLDPARAGAVPGVRALSPADLYDAVDIVLNLTSPAAHQEVALAAIAAGKPVYGEKPLAPTTKQAREILDAAATAGVLVGPNTSAEHVLTRPEAAFPAVGRR